MHRKNFPRYASAKLKHFMTAQRKHKKKPGRITLNYQAKGGGKLSVPIEPANIKRVVIEIDTSVVEHKSPWTLPIEPVMTKVEPLVIFKEVDETFKFTKPSSNWTLPTPPVVFTWTVPDIFEIHREWWSKVVDMKLD